MGDAEGVAGRRTGEKLLSSVVTGLGEVNVGMFWHDCKNLRRCWRSPYDRLLTHPVLRADYHSHPARHEK